MNNENWLDVWNQACSDFLVGLISVDAFKAASAEAQNSSYNEASK